ncbi:MAG: zinc ribbon domain-containing protein [Candidatus Aenigmarchaeota archaeon]|nr:zinc ribbon domain-containing protein [Candidatus Aenigmarchaeota archaeon]
MRCPNCSADVDRKWSYCPSCGLRMRSMDSFLAFPSFDFSDIDREMDRMRKRMMGDMKKAMTEGPKGSGFSISIVSSGGKEPKVEVRTFGDYKGKEDEILRGSGVPKKAIEKEPSKRKVPEITEEPKYEVKRIGSRLIFSVKLHGVKDLRDVDVRALEESVEVRAYAENKAYFTIFPVPRGAKIVNQTFGNDELVIEIKI